MSEIRGVKFIWKKIRGLKIYPEKIRGLKILGLSEENTPGGYSPLKMSAPLGSVEVFVRENLTNYLKRLNHKKSKEVLMIIPG